MKTGRQMKYQLLVFLFLMGCKFGSQHTPVLNSANETVKKKSDEPPKKEIDPEVTPTEEWKSFTCGLGAEKNRVVPRALKLNSNEQSSLVFIGTCEGEKVSSKCKPRKLRSDKIINFYQKKQNLKCKKNKDLKILALESSCLSSDQKKRMLPLKLLKSKEFYQSFKRVH